jgi:hypothetical protein
MHICKYNGKLMKLVLENNLTSNDMLYLGHMDFGSCLTIAAKFQPLALKYLLDWKELDWKIIHTFHKKKNFLTIASKYSPIAVKYAIKSPIDLHELIYCNSNETPFVNACRYQPDAVKSLLNSKYGSLSLILWKIDEKTCLDEAYDCQPKSLLNILKSKFGNDLLNLEDDRGYRLIFKIKSIFSHVNKLEDVEKISLTHYHNQVTKEYKNQCEICCTYKKVVIFFPCLHMTCVGCAFKLKNCPKCRSVIDKRKIIFD